MGKFLDNPYLIVVLLLVIIVVFGANKLPVAAKSLGQSLRIFKNEMRPDDSKEGLSGSASSDQTSSPGQAASSDSDRAS